MAEAECCGIKGSKVLMGFLAYRLSAAQAMALQYVKTKRLVYLTNLRRGRLY